ncbi:MAG: hypothetical protein U7123_11455 [Potamolinea sp.]
MISASGPKKPVITQSKINHKSGVLHPLARFVTEETAAFLFDIKPEEIYRIDCWRHVVYVHAKGVSKFVSYADFPPIIGVEIPTTQDFVRWRKRWRNHSQKYQAPSFWTHFYQQQFQKADCETNLLTMGKLVAIIKPLLLQVAVEQLREVYKQQQYYWANF